MNGRELSQHRVLGAPTSGSRRFAPSNPHFGADTAPAFTACACLGFPDRQAVLSTHARVPLNSRPLGEADLNPNRYLYVLNLEDNTSSKATRPLDLPGIDDAYIESFGKCATIEMPEGVLYIVGHSRCGPKMWLLASGTEENRPNAPWAAFRGFGHEKAAALAWSWLSSREIL